LPCMQQPRLRELLVSPVLLRAFGLHATRQRRGRIQQRGQVHQQNAAEVVTQQFIRDLHT